MRIKISAGAERDIADGCDFYYDIAPGFATYFHDSISADIDSLMLYAGVHAKCDGWHFTFAGRNPVLAHSFSLVFCGQVAVAELDSLFLQLIFAGHHVHSLKSNLCSSCLTSLVWSSHRSLTTEART
jgi:hypothetical protein